ncbi:MAG: hypothetical protein A3F92_02525 [Candidatus Rokubacteria bacterium RIFCSPLOWO2_12_FULL_71_22]|nr:MAG: hypothetical protein A3F92_02525 [Candidatus Rokubacteria bacterium RIFCSPLOWO2_12_FULL_71_22]
MPSTIERVHREFGPRGLTVLAVNLGEDRAEVSAWVRRRGVTSTVLLDERGDAARAYQVAFTPTVFLVSRDGRLVAKGTGTKAWTGPAGRALLEALIAR